MRVKPEEIVLGALPRGIYKLCRGCNGRIFLQCGSAKIWWVDLWVPDRDQRLAVLLPAEGHDTALLRGISHSASLDLTELISEYYELRSSIQIIKAAAQKTKQNRLAKDLIKGIEDRMNQIWGHIKELLVYDPEIARERPEPEDWRQALKEGRKTDLYKKNRFLV